MDAFMDTPFGREGSKGSKGAEGSKGGGGAPFKKKGRQYEKNVQPPWRAREKRSPFGGFATTFPPVQGTLWVLSNLLHDSKGKRRAVYSPL